MKRFIVLLYVLFLSISVFAQLEIKEDSFKLCEGFVNINNEKMYDDNDKPYAVLKIKTVNINSKERHELKFGGDAQTFFEIEYKDGEVWLYISYYATYLKISHEELSSTEFHFPFDMKPKCGYELTLINKQATVDDIIKRIEKLEGGGDNENAGDIVSNNSKSIYNSSSINASGFVEKPFSVNYNQTVYFSSGNLQYQASTDTWRFAETQWDVVGEANKLISPKNKGWIDLFGWGTGDNPTKISKKIGDYVTFNDWGKNIISNSKNTNWRTMTKSEWEYLLFKRKTISGMRFAKAQVNGVNGLILLPDDWDASIYILNKINSQESSFLDNEITEFFWTKYLEPNGAVFIPCAGYRLGRGYSDYGKDNLYYWTATGIRPYYVHNYYKEIKIDNYFNKGNGLCFSVRLVRYVE